MLAIVVTAHRVPGAACTAPLFVAVLALGLWLPGSSPLVRERPLRRPARAGWSARALAAGAWIVPERDVRALSPGAGGGDQDDVPVLPAVSTAAVRATAIPVTTLARLAPAGVPPLHRTVRLAPGRAPPVLALQHDV